eukprot:6489050-Amphidinium_carterae.1
MLCVASYSAPVEAQAMPFVMQTMKAILLEDSKQLFAVSGYWGIPQGFCLRETHHVTLLFTLGRLFLVLPSFPPAL